MHKLNIGDLVCYNAGGMKHKTLGIVMDFDFVSKIQNRSAKSILIMWSVVGEYMPRTCWSLEPNRDRRKKIKPNQLVWHELGEWIEVVK